MKRAFLILLAVPLLMAAKPMPTGSMELVSTAPVTISITSDWDVHGWVSYFYVYLQCDNGYLAYDVASSPAEGVSFGEDPEPYGGYTEGLVPGGECYATMIGVKYNAHGTNSETYYLDQIEFDV